MPITGAELFVKALKAERVSTLFAYPGGQAIDLFDALYGEREIDLIVPRHEQGLIHAADGYARSTGKVGVCLVTSGPGAANLVTGIATANSDGVPLVCFTGQVSTDRLGDDAFQEIDIVGIARSISKYAVLVRKREDLGAAIKRAFFVARSGRPGVVVVDLPKDVQRALGGETYPDEAEIKMKIRGYKPQAPLCAAQIREAMDVLWRAQKPVILAGGGVCSGGARTELQAFAEATGAPVVTTVLGKDAIPTAHALYVGNLGLHGSYAANSAISQCDVLFSIGTRLNDRIAGKPDAFAPGAVKIHVDLDFASVSRAGKIDLPIAADAKTVLRVCMERATRLQIEPWKAQIRAWKVRHPLVMKEKGLTPQKIIEAINRLFEKAIVVTDVGQNQLWTTQFLELNEYKRLLTSGGMGTMGYGFPAALGAKIGNPATDVIAISGDGGMQMNIQEMATAVAYELPVIACVMNNGYLGNVRQWQKLFFDGRYSGTCTRFRKSCPSDCVRPADDCPEYIPDFVKLAESYGARGIRVTKEDEIAAAFLAARRETKVPTILECIIAREANVMPIVPPGNALQEMVLEGGVRT